MPRFLSITGLPRFSSRRLWLTLGMCGVIVLASIVLIFGLGNSTTTEMTFLYNSESVRADNLLMDSGLGGESPVTETVIVRALAGTIDDVQKRAEVEHIKPPCPELLPTNPISRYSSRPARCFSTSRSTGLRDHRPSVPTLSGSSPT